MLTLNYGILNYSTNTGVTSSEFIVQFVVPSDNYEIVLPTSNGYNFDYTVDYDDGTPIRLVTLYNDTGATHTFATAGTYNVKINGTCESFYTWWGGTPNTMNAIRKIINWGNVGLIQFNLAGCGTLNEIPEDTLGGLSKIIQFQYTFYGTQLTTIPSGLFTYCTSATTFYGVFAYTSTLTSIPSGLFDNCTAATTIAYMFYATSITSIPSGLFNNNALVTDLSQMFGSTQITSIPSGLFDNNPLVQNFQNLFAYCYYLTSIPSGLFDNNTLASNFSQIFYSCYQITSIPSGLFDLTSVNNLGGAFYGCTALVGAAPEYWLDFPSATGTDCFRNDNQLTNYDIIPEDWGGNYQSLRLYMQPLNNNETFTIPLLSGYTYDFILDWNDWAAYPPAVHHITSWNDTGLTHTYQYGIYYGYTIKISGTCESFYISDTGDTLTTAIRSIASWGNVGLKALSLRGCKYLTTVPSDVVSGFTNMIDFSYAFAYCTGLTNILSNFFQYATIANDFSYAFAYCTELLSAPELWLTYTGATGTNCFTGDTMLPDYRYIPADWGGLGLLRQPFKMELTVPTGSSTAIQIPHLNGYVYNYDVDYGDGSPVVHVSSYNDPNTQHTYESGGTGVYIVQMSGICGSIYIWSDTIYQWLTKILQWGDTGFRTLAFMSCYNLTEIASDTSGLITLQNANYMLFNTAIVTIPPGFLSGCTQLSQTQYMFYNCQSLVSMGEGAFNNCTSLTYMDNMFQYCIALTGISATLFSGCTNLYQFSYMFQYCQSLTGNTPEFWNTHPSASGNMCFNGCWGLDNFLDIPTNWGGAGIDPSTVIGFTKFYKPNYVNWSSVYDNISSNVHITRKNSQPIFNIVSESGWDATGSTSPADTEWNSNGWSGISGLSDVTGRTYGYWIDVVGYSPPAVVAMELVMHAITDDAYYKITWIGWTSGNAGGGFAYYRQQIT